MKLTDVVRCVVTLSDSQASMANSLCSQMGIAMNYSPSVKTLKDGSYFIPYPTINGKTTNFGCGFLPPNSWKGDNREHPAQRMCPCCRYDPSAKKLETDSKAFYWNFFGESQSNNPTNGYYADGEKCFCLIFSPLEKDIFSVFGAVTQDSETAMGLAPAHQLLLGPYGSTHDFMVYAPSSEGDKKYRIYCEGGSKDMNSTTVSYRTSTYAQEEYIVLQRVICDVSAIANLYVTSPLDNTVIKSYFNLANYNAYHNMMKAGFILGDKDYRGLLNPGNETIFFIRTDYQEESDILDYIGENEGEPDGEDYWEDDND